MRAPAATCASCRGVRFREAVALTSSEATNGGLRLRSRSRCGQTKVCQLPTANCQLILQELRNIDLIVTDLQLAADAVVHPNVAGAGAGALRRPARGGAVEAGGDHGHP